VHNDGVGHVGKVRTYARLRKLPGFPWGLTTSEVYKNVKDECEGCLTCLKIWATRGEREAASGAVIRQRPWTEVAIDLVVLTEPDVDGHKNILVIIDSFSRAVELFPLKAGDADSVAACLFDVYHRYGKPVRVRCDRAKAFLKSVLFRFQKLLGVQTHPTLIPRNRMGSVKEQIRKLCVICGPWSYLNRELRSDGVFWCQQFGGS